MIITCNNCNKKFNLDSNLIPDKGRLLECASCNHKWFFKKEILEKTVSSIVEDIDSNNVLDQHNLTNTIEINPSDLLKEKIEVNNEEVLNKKIDVNIDENKTVNDKAKKQKNYKILNIFVVVIISFVAFIIIVDTFKYPIGQVVPNVEFILYNLYESIKDISLFIKDLT